MSHVSLGYRDEEFISDRHTSIAKWMREDCLRICHEMGKPKIDYFFLFVAHRKK